MSKIIAERETKVVGSLTSDVAGELTTAVICMCASGIYAPLMLIFPRVRMKHQFTVESPPGSLLVCHQSGWVQLKLFEQWFDQFVRYT